ncbi:MAG: HAD-IIB family hydrolase [Saprospiraceae bacterium]|nr:HAD-IIB family hydrolase [Saprospiraceae bacterium]
MPQPPFILFSDLDGTLLDTFTYQPDGAEAALACLREVGVPLVFCSSKTFEEIVFYQKQLGIHAPFIVENGGAVFVPDGYFHFEIGLEKRRAEFWVKEFGAASAFIRQKLAGAAADLELDVRGFSDLSVSQLAALTGLDEAAAGRAARKDYSETLAAPSDPKSLARLERYLVSPGLALTSGSRFFTVHGANADKGRAAEWLMELFRQVHENPLIAAVGDATNDIPLLRQADKAFLVQKTDGSWVDAGGLPVELAPAPGPKGFDWVVRHLLRNV